MDKWKLNSHRVLCSVLFAAQTHECARTFAMASDERFFLSFFSALKLTRLYGLSSSSFVLLLLFSAHTQVSLSCVLMETKKNISLWHLPRIINCGHELGRERL
jgi:hypothetical protein